MAVRIIGLKDVTSQLLNMETSLVAETRIFKGFQDYLVQRMGDSTNTLFNDARRIGSVVVCVMDRRMVCIELKSATIVISAEAEINLSPMEEYILDLARECKLKIILAPLIKEQIEDSSQGFKDNVPIAVTIELIKMYIEETS